MRKLKIELDCGQAVTVHPPTVGQYYKERRELENDDELFGFIARVYSRNDEGITFTAEDVLERFTTDDLDRFTTVYLDWVQSEKESDPN